VLIWTLFIVRHHLEYVCQVWEPSEGSTDTWKCSMLACQLCLKCWDLEALSIPTSEYRKYLNGALWLCVDCPLFLLQILHMGYILPWHVTIVCPITHTRYMISHLPQTISLWNNLPVSAVPIGILILNFLYWRIYASITRYCMIHPLLAIMQ